MCECDTKLEVRVGIGLPDGIKVATAERVNVFLRPYLSERAECQETATELHAVATPVINQIFSFFRTERYKPNKGSAKFKL